MSNKLHINNFDRTDLHIIFIYDDEIAERKKERLIEGVRLVEIKEGNLHSIENYIAALQIILNIRHLANRVVPIVADWPEQLFIHKAITNLHKVNLQCPIPAKINSLVSIIRPFYISLNSKKQALITYYPFFEKMFHFIFGKKKKLAKKPKL